MKNTMNKTRTVDNPYEVYRSDLLPDWEWRVLRKYQTPENEEKNPYAKWFVAAKSPNTWGEWEYGDTYVNDILIEAHAYQVRECPTCKDWYKDYPALSRRDNKTEICPQCGTDEAMEDYINYQKSKTNKR